jgi:hypothetical protein
VAPDDGVEDRTLHRVARPADDGRRPRPPARHRRAAGPRACSTRAPAAASPASTRHCPRSGTRSRSGSTKNRRRDRRYSIAVTS